MEDTEADLHLASIDRSGEAKNKKTTPDRLCLSQQIHLHESCG
jgi:hypothetical protein